MPPATSRVGRRVEIVCARRHQQRDRVIHYIARVDDSRLETRRAGAAYERQHARPSQVRVGPVRGTIERAAPSGCCRSRCDRSAVHGPLGVVQLGRVDAQRAAGVILWQCGLGAGDLQSDDGLVCLRRHWIGGDERSLKADRI